MYLLLGSLLFLSRTSTRRVTFSLASFFFLVTVIYETGWININRTFWRIESLTGFEVARICLFGCKFFMSAWLALCAPGRISGSVGIRLLELILASANTDLFKAVDGLLLPVVVVYIALQGPNLLRRLKPRHDLSYGIYLYAFPIQQIVASAGFTGADGWLAALCLSFVAALAFAYWSWTLIEGPALQWKRTLQPRMS